MRNDLPIYLDYMASTPLDREVARKMLPYLQDDRMFGNPHSQHEYGFRAMQAIELAKTQIANYINSSEDEIIFTSGATEANNLAIKGAAQFYKRKGKHIITCSTEHKAVLEPIEWLVDNHDFSMTVIKPQSDGLIDIQDIKKAITPETLLISIMHVNNEIGVIQPIQAIGELAKDNGILLHVDAAQSVGKLPIDVKLMNVGLMSFSSHKAYGPMGVGALYIRKSPRIRLSELIHGGGQQMGIRSGTLPTSLIVGMGAAFEISGQRLEKDQTKIADLRELFMNEISNISGIIFHGSDKSRVSNNINMSVEGVDLESLLYSVRRLAISTASACVTTTQEGSYVLRALGIPDHIAQSAVRISFGRYTTHSEVEEAIDLLIKQITRLRKISGWDNNGV